MPQPLPQLPSDRPIPFKSPQSPSPDGEDLLNIPGTITVKEFRFEGNTAFSDRELAQITAPYIKEDLSFGELLQAEAAVRDKYLQGCDANNRVNDIWNTFQVLLAYILKAQSRVRIPPSPLQPIGCP